MVATPTYLVSAWRHRADTLETDGMELARGSDCFLPLSPRFLISFGAPVRIQSNQLVYALIASLAASMATGCVDDSISDDDALAAAEGDDLAADDKADGIGTVSTYFMARRDFRECLSPRCGGIWVKRVNQATTRCVDGANRSECYVPTATFSALNATVNETSYLADRLAGGALVVRGSIAPKNYNGFGNLGVLKVTEAWDSATGSAPTGTFFAVRDSGIRCVQLPCPTLRTANLNSTTSANITDLFLDGVEHVSTTAVENAMNDAFTSKILVTGNITAQRGSVVLRATQFFVAFARKLELVGEWRYRRSSSSSQFVYQFNADNTFTSFERPACAFQTPPCLAKIPAFEGTYSLAEDGTSLHLVYTTASRLGATADFVAQGKGTATKLVGRDNGVSLSLTMVR